MTKSIPAMSAEAPDLTVEQFNSMIRDFQTERQHSPACTLIGRVHIEQEQLILDNMVEAVQKQVAKIRELMAQYATPVKS